MFEKKIFGQVQKKERPNLRKCKVKIKRDNHGKVVGYESTGCTKEEQKAVMSNDEFKIEPEE